ncbi:hypothetical protein B0H14DRAFT_2396560, partial [Mycena olivaceomarginata]
MRVLRHAGRHREAQQVLQRGLADGSQKCWTDGIEVFHLHFHFLLVELAATSGLVGQLEKALEHAEKAVAVCRKRVDAQTQEAQKCVLVHSLTTLSNCLAAIGRNDKALAVAREAFSIYTQQKPDMWEIFLNTIRKQELGANALHSLSMQLTTSGETDRGLENAEKATELYRELAALVPRHFPTLAGSLRNLASALWNVGRPDHAIAACEEAVSIMRGVVDRETYLLPALAETLEQL